MSKHQPSTPRKPASKFAHLKQKLSRNKVAANLVKREKYHEEKRSGKSGSRQTGSGR